MVLPLPEGIATATQLDPSDRNTYQLNGCHIPAVDLEDIGLVG